MPSITTTTTVMITTTHRGFTVRPDTLDSYVVNELTTYRHMPIVAGDCVLDVGGNIGSFAALAIKCGAEKVVSVEPDEENLALLRVNAPEAQIIHAAVVGPDTTADHVLLYKNIGKNKGLHSTVPTRGRDTVTVPAVQWQTLLSGVHPNKIKIDCEGAEYAFLRPAQLPAHVTDLIMEYNLSRRGEQEKANHTHQQFLQSGWHCTKPPRFGTKAWATLACYTRIIKV